MNVSNDTMTRYLLGELSDEEQTALEKAYFEDSRVFAEVSDVEHGLIDDYVRGKLSPGVRDRFERVYLADPRRRDRVAFAQAFVARADAAAAPNARRRAWFPQLAVAALAVIAIAAGLFWFVSQPSSLQQGSTQAGGAAPAKPPAPTPPETPDRGTVPSSVAPIEPVPTLALVLAPGVRSAETRAPATLVIPAGAVEARLALTIQEPEAERLRVSLRAVDGAEIARRDLAVRAGATGAALTLNLPASRLSSGDYMLTLQGATRGGEFEDLSQSLFRVLKR